jgi:hypothetical protein
MTDNKTKKNFIIILLMLITGLLIYYLYMKPTDTYTYIEKFTEPITTQPITTQPITTQPQFTCPQATIAQLPISIISRFFGIGFNIYPANNTIQSTLPTNITNTNLFLIEHIPVVHNNALGSMYAISSDGQLTIKLRNDQDSTQWWILTTKTDNKSTYYIITPFTQTSTPLALQYENGNLSLRPYTDTDYESQKWITSTSKITRGIPVLNYNPASLFTPEFDPYSTTTNINSTTLTQQNNQQVSNVLSTIKANIQQYLTQIGSTNQSVPPVSASSLGNKDMPLNINLNLGSNTQGGSTLSAFANITGTTTPTDILKLLDRYENTTGTPNNTDTLYLTTDLQSALNKSGECTTVNIGDYTSNRVSSCNCKL